MALTVFEITEELLRRQEIKVRHPRFPKWIGACLTAQRYENRVAKWIQSLPKNGDIITITYLPPAKNAPTEKNAYCPATGVVQDMNPVDGWFSLKTPTATLVIPNAEKFNYIKHPF